MYFSLFTLALGFVFLSFCFSREIISCKYFNNISTIVCSSSHRIIYVQNCCRNRHRLSVFLHAVRKRIKDFGSDPMYTLLQDMNIFLKAKPGIFELHLLIEDSNII